MDTSDEKPDIQSSLQDGFSRMDETARRVADDAAKKGEDLVEKGEALAERAQGYAHQGLETANKAGQAVAGAIRERPFVSLMVAGLTGAMIALAGRMR